MRVGKIHSFHKSGKVPIQLLKSIIKPCSKQLKKKKRRSHIETEQITTKRKVKNEKRDSFINQNS